jgi:hypothetical protein
VFGIYSQTLLLLFFIFDFLFLNVSKKVGFLTFLFSKKSKEISTSLMASSLSTRKPEVLLISLPLIPPNGSFIFK